MNVLTLIIGLMLPWLAGSAVLMNLGGLRSAAGRPYVLAGYGFFLGYALLYLLVMASAAFTGGPRFAPIAAILAVISTAGLVREAWRARQPGPHLDNLSAPYRHRGSWQRVMLLVLGSWLLAHMLFAGLEVITTPLFPWDAFTVWVYRAKAWFLGGQIFDFLTVLERQQTGSGLAYTLPAPEYPLLVSVAHYWAAVSYGQWHEALVNVPTWMCGLAIVLGFYGQCRSLGSSLLTSVALAYLLVSTPLFGAHVSLGGYADIWLTGFAGLGFVALLYGLSVREARQVILGFALLALGLLIKDEGVVWLLAAMAFCVMAVLPARLVLTVALATLLAGAGLAYFGWTWIELPLVGAVGYRDGFLHVPLAGAYALEVHDVSRAYLRNAYLLGSWNLAWVLVPVAFTLALVRSRERPGKTVVSFVLIFAATQLAIFACSEAGAWAEDHTAINRLPLQLYPALLFTAAVICRAAFQRRENQFEAPLGRNAENSFWRALGVFILAGTLTIIGAFAWLRLDHPGASVDPISLGPAKFIAVVGTTREAGERRVANGYSNGMVLLSSGPLSFDSSEHYLLRIAIDSDPDLRWPDEAPAFFWRTSLSPNTVSRVTLDGSSLVDLSVTEDWAGEITEIGLLFPEHAGRPAVFAGLSLEGRNLSTTLELLPRQWLEFEPWTQKSMNALHGGAPDQAIPLNFLVTIWVLLALLALAVFPARFGGLKAGAMALLAGWMLLDARWTVNQVRQMIHSWRSLATQTIEQRIVDSELGRYYPWIDRLKDGLLGDEPMRILLLRDPAEFEYFAWRSKYQLLPHAVSLPSRLREGISPQSVDYVIFLGDFAPSDTQGASTAQRVSNLPMAPSWNGRLQLLDVSEEGLLYRVRPD